MNVCEVCKSSNIEILREPDFRCLECGFAKFGGVSYQKTETIVVPKKAEPIYKRVAKLFFK